MEKEEARDVDGELERINEGIRDLTPPLPEKRERKPYITYLLAALLALAIIVSAVYLGPQLVGLITFGETTVSAEDTSFEITKNTKIRLEPGIENVDAVMLSGTVYGNGRATVFLETENGRRLAYYFEGNADGPDGEGTRFDNLCFETCRLTDAPKDLILSARMDNTRLAIDKVTYMSSKLIDMELLPAETTIDYDKERTKTVELTLTNNLKSDYSAVLLVDGPLTDFFSWEGSMIRMNANETEKKIPITLKLPRNLGAGEYQHRITARYVTPESNQQLTGTAPSAEAYIKVINREY